MREARQRFVAAFPAQCDALAALLDQRLTTPGAALTPLRGAVHRLAGLAGTVGFPAVSVAAAQLEDAVQSLDGAAPNLAGARVALQSIRDAFAKDLASPPSWSAPDGMHASVAEKILIADDDDALRAVVSEYLQALGYATVSTATGDTVVEHARAERPAVILLDVDMPGLDGYSACRLLKTDAELSHIPVIFMTTRAGLDERLAGLTLGADEFLPKPLDMLELALRIRLLADRSRGARQVTPDVAGDRALDYQAFLSAARDALQRTGGAVAMLRVPGERRRQVGEALVGELRRRDIVGALDGTHLLVMFPQLTAAAARDGLAPVFKTLAGQDIDVHGGIAAAEAGSTIEALLARADEALVQARYTAQPTAIWSERPPAPAQASASPIVLLADDDPEVARIVDAHMRAAGYSTAIAFDGEQAWSALQTRTPDVLVLDLMMPKANGFDVLTRLRHASGRRPKVVVLSARGREQDVTRAFELGADDYMNKPFNPQELLARVGRLLR